MPAPWLQTSALARAQVSIGYNSDLNEFAAEAYIAPRTGAFEIYVDIGAPQGKQFVVKMFSKRLKGVWPHVGAVMKRIDQAFRESTAGVDISILEDKYRAKVV